MATRQRQHRAPKRAVLPMISSLPEKILMYGLGTMLFFSVAFTIMTFQSLPPITKNLYHLPVNRALLRSQFDIDNQAKDDEEEEEITKFPLSIHDTPFETIIHPAVEISPDINIPNLTVPIFFDPPKFKQYNGIRSYLGNYGETLMTLEQAQNVGSFHHSNNKHNNNGLETIFVAIASYRDFQCRQTIESILTRAKHPERIRIAVVDQLNKDDGDTPCSQPEYPCEEHPNQVLCKYSQQLDFYTMDAQYAMGPVFARHLGNRMYRGEYFAMQCDAHVDFILDWDDLIIQQWKASKNEMAVLTAYLSGIEGGIDEQGNLLKMSRPIMCKSDWEGNGKWQHLRHGQQPEGEAQIKGEPTLEPYWAAGYSFSRGHFIVNVPYDQHLPWVFQGEEISIGLRGFTFGYDYYTPEHSVCFHYYASQEGSTGKRKHVKLFWENSKNFDQHKISDIEKGGMMRLNGILHMNPPSVKETDWLHTEEKTYGLGKVRTTQKFFDTFGVDVVGRKTEDHLCQFAGKNMQRVFQPHLRSDTMGINYDEISFRFQDPVIHERTWEKLLPKAQKK